MKYIWRLWPQGSEKLHLYLRWISVCKLIPLYTRCTSPVWGGVKKTETVWHLGGWNIHQWLRHLTEDESFHQTSCHYTIRPQSGHVYLPIAVSLQHRETRRRNHRIVSLRKAHNHITFLIPDWLLARGRNQILEMWHRWLCRKSMHAHQHHFSIVLMLSLTKHWAKGVPCWVVVTEMTYQVWCVVCYSLLPSPLSKPKSQLNSDQILIHRKGLFVSFLSVNKITLYYIIIFVLLWWYIVLVPSIHFNWQSSMQRVTILVVCLSNTTKINSCTFTAQVITTRQNIYTHKHHVQNNVPFSSLYVM